MSTLTGIVIASVIAGTLSIIVSAILGLIAIRLTRLARAEMVAAEERAVERFNDLISHISGGINELGVAFHDSLTNEEFLKAFSSEIGAAAFASYQARLDGSAGGQGLPSSGLLMQIRDLAGKLPIGQEAGGGQPSGFNME